MSVKNFFTKMFKKNEKKSLDLEKITIRASLKDIMKMRGLRSISISNYRRYQGDENPNAYWLHSLRLDPMSGYINMFSPRTGTDPRAGAIITDTTLSQYQEAYKVVQDILTAEPTIPSKVKRNILVAINR